MVLVIRRRRAFGALLFTVRRGCRATTAALHALVPWLLHGGMVMPGSLIAALAVELTAMRVTTEVLLSLPLLQAKVVMMLLRTTRAAKAGPTLRAAKVLRSLLRAKAVAETLATPKAASGAEPAAALAEARVLTEALAKAMPKVLLRTAGASGRAALGAVKVLSATGCAELAAMPKGLRATTTEATTKAAVLMPARPLLMLEAVVLLMVLSTSLRRWISRAGASLRLGVLPVLWVVLATLLTFHRRTAEVTASLIVVHAAVVSTLGIGRAAPAFTLGRVQGGAGSGAFRALGCAARDLRTRGALAGGFGTWRFAALRCGGRGRALRSGLGRRRGLVGRLGILG